MLRTWVFEFLPELTDQSSPVPPKTISEYICRYLSLWERDEALGFDGIFFSEHHFGDSYSSSPNLLIAATAARTKTIRLGVMGVVVPYYTAARVIEEIGLLDQLSGGRLEIGTAVGVPQELAKLGLNLDQAREIYNETIEILDTTLETGIANYHGKHFKYDNLRLLPRPVQTPHPPKWSTVVNPDTARRAARRKSKICTGFNSTEQVREVFEAYIDESRAMGQSVDGNNLGLRRRVIVSESESEANKMSQSAAERYKKFLANDPRIKLSPVPDAPRQGGGGFSVSDDEFISGTPLQVANKIIEQCKRTGARHFLAVLHWGAQLTEVRSAHELFGQQVIPILKKAKL
ncbi:MAG TPA: LLM class flavin-dependent oxidoreductase [Pseudolabrys sp.]|jgi:alkanesulfonate monooxygenase SsuD/methylene tetrahydromethanopterin reductase-like flavin-dependent oxidoreductase (luciferase family)|nr:LLM class flavin-dependent oxidoreductase [Pseudolabrys sp.]